MKSYFFVPASKEKYLKRINKIDCSEVIIDLEDSIFNSSLEEAIESIISLDLSLNNFIRIPFYPGQAKNQFDVLKKLLESGYNKFVIPKVEREKDVNLFIDFYRSIMQSKKNPKLVVLIENPLAIENLKEIVANEFVFGVGFGSHDYCASTGIKHDNENILWARMQIVNTGKAYNKEIIDIASMTLQDKAMFEKECIDGFEKGHDGKFLIHPWQLDIFNSLKWYSEDEIQQAVAVKDYISKIGGESNFSIAKINNTIVEKPHLTRIKIILKQTGHESF